VGRTGPRNVGELPLTLYEVPGPPIPIEIAARLTGWWQSQLVEMRRHAELGTREDRRRSGVRDDTEFTFDEVVRAAASRWFGKGKRRFVPALATTEIPRTPFVLVRLRARVWSEDPRVLSGPIPVTRTGGRLVYDPASLIENLGLSWRADPSSHEGDRPDSPAALTTAAPLPIRPGDRGWLGDLRRACGLTRTDLLTRSNLTADEVSGLEAGSAVDGVGRYLGAVAAATGIPLRLEVRASRGGRWSARLVEAPLTGAEDAPSRAASD
jgi:hypothetical protein